MTTTKPRAPSRKPAATASRGPSSAARTPRAGKSAAVKTAQPTAKTAAKKVVAKKVAAKKVASKKVATKQAVARKSVAKQAAKTTRPAAKAVRKAAGQVAPTSRKAGQPKRNATKPRPRKSVDSNARLRQIVLAALDDMKARDIREIDVRGRSDFADLMIVASGTSSRHVKAIADTVVIKAKAAGLPPLGVEGTEDAEWVLVDLGDIIVHVMQPRTREFYGLERLWTVGDDAPTPAAAAAE